MSTTIFERPLSPGFYWFRGMRIHEKFFGDWQMILICYKHNLQDTGYKALLRDQYVTVLHTSDYEMKRSPELDARHFFSDWRQWQSIPVISPPRTHVMPGTRGQLHFVDSIYSDVCRECDGRGHVQLSGQPDKTACPLCNGTGMRNYPINHIINPVPVVPDEMNKTVVSKEDQIALQAKIDKPRPAGGWMEDREEKPPSDDWPGTPVTVTTESPPGPVTPTYPDEVMEDGTRIEYYFDGTHKNIKRIVTPPIETPTGRTPTEDPELQNIPCPSLEKTPEDFFVPKQKVRPICKTCHGRGKSYSYGVDFPCTRCNGSGRTKREE